MTFLNPAVLIGLLAAAIPVIIHLLNLRKLKKIEFSTLAFLKELQKNKIRKIKIKQWLLLVLRVMIILLIVFAFARPALRGFNIAGTTSAAKTTAVLIIDDTFSMSVLSQNGSYFNQAKDLARQVIEQLKEGDEAALIFLSEVNKQPNLTSDFASLINQLNQKEISFGNAKLTDAMTMAADLVDKSKNFNREIYLFTDFQKNIFPPADLKSDLSDLLNENIKLYSFSFTDKKVFNLGIDELKINSQIFEKDKPISFSVNVSNYSDQDVKNGVLSLFINEKRAAQKSFDVETGKTVLVDIEASADASGFVDVSAEIEPDDIEYDNKRFNSLFIPDKISILIVADDDESSKFIKLALKTISNEKIILEERNSNKINGIELKNYDVIFICSENIIQSSDKLNQYLKNGGSIIIFPSSKAEIERLNDVLKKFDLPVTTGIAGKINDKSLTASFDKIDYNHPIFVNLFRKEGKKNVESPSVNYFLKYSTQGKGTSIIQLTDGSSFLSEFKVGNGKIFFFNISGNIGWSNFPLKTIFAPLLIKSVFYLSQKENLKSNIIAGEPYAIELNKIKSAQIKILRPDSTTDYINLDLANQKYLEYKNTNLSGFYKVYSGKELIENLAVNHDKSESNPDYADKNVFEKFLKQINFKGNLISIDKNKNPLEAINQARFGSELWRIFLLIALILAIIEMSIARNIKKDLEGINT